MDQFEIFFSDLTPECQERLLKFVGISTPEEANWDMDIIPIAEYPKPEED